jgi:UDP-N-acetylglucosamine 1-carboxyvinyltransferase
VNFHEKLALLGADIERVKEEEHSFSDQEDMVTDLNA